MLGLAVLGPVVASCGGARVSSVAQVQPRPASAATAPAVARSARSAPKLVADDDLHDDGYYLVGSTVDPKPLPPPPLAMDDTLLPATQMLVARLRDEAQFVIGGAGWVNQISFGENRTRELARQPDAIAAFEWLANQYRPVPRLYAYWALRALAPERAQAHLEALMHDRRHVEAMAGCLVFNKLARDLAIEVQQAPAPSL